MPSFRILLFLACLACYSKSYSQAIVPVNVDEQKAARPKEIKKLKDCKLPDEMVYRIQQMSPKEMKQLIEEYQSIIREDGEEYVVTVKLRFIEDHIFGYIKQAPLTNSANEEASTTRIIIPVEYCCTPKKLEHQKHCVKISEIPLYDSTEKCVGWALKEEENKEAAGASAAQIKANLKKKKNAMPEMDSAMLASIDKLNKKDRKKVIAEWQAKQKAALDSANRDSSGAPLSRKELIKQEKERAKKAKLTRESENKEASDSSNTESAAPIDKKKLEKELKAQREAEAKERQRMADSIKTAEKQRTDSIKAAKKEEAKKLKELRKKGKSPSDNEEEKTDAGEQPKQEANKPD